MLRLESCGCDRYLFFEELQRFPFIFHLFTVTPEQRVPERPHSRERLEQLLGCLGRPERLVFTRQVHGNQVHWFGRQKTIPQQGDGWLGDAPGALLLTQTADCLPILLVDAKRRIVGNLHAGWRGTLAGIAGTAIRKLIDSGSRPEDLWMALGPGIGNCCYEVGPEVLSAFEQQYPGAQAFFHPQPGSERKCLDLKGASTEQALNLGLRPEQILSNSFCTKCSADLFPSYRRDGIQAGRMFAVIGIQ